MDQAKLPVHEVAVNMQALSHRTVDERTILLEPEGLSIENRYQ